MWLHVSDLLSPTGHHWNPKNIQNFERIQILPAIKHFDTSFDSTIESTVDESANYDHSVQYQPLTHLYVPYVMQSLNSSYGALLNGDLIDLSCTENTSIVSQDEVIRFLIQMFWRNYYSSPASYYLQKNKKTDPDYHHFLFPMMWNKVTPSDWDRKFIIDAKQKQI